jgi:hypothetical protein
LLKNEIDKIIVIPVSFVPLGTMLNIWSLVQWHVMLKKEIAVFVESVCNCSATVDCMNVVLQEFFIVFLLISKTVAVHVIYGNNYIINSCCLLLFKLLA